ncbi:MAG TPA: thioesterase family protein [Acidobacteriaceae bacterium]|nr:thioesterase family protein [Acidobacteriaceae bacterium]
MNRLFTARFFIDRVFADNSFMPPSVTTIRVRYAETDQMGVAYHSNFLIWCEVGRVELLRQLGFEYSQMEIEHAVHLPVAEANCRYRAPARYDDVVTIETRVAALRSTVIKFAYRLFTTRPDAAEPVLLAEAETVHVSVDRAMNKCPIPEHYLSAIRGTMDD